MRLGDHNVKRTMGGTPDEGVTANNQGVGAQRRPGVQDICIERTAGRWSPGCARAAVFLRDSACWVGA